MPLRLGDADKNRQAAMETAVIDGLQKKYEVFSGEQVAQKAREIFMKESRANVAQHKDCDETRCMQSIAEAFQAELIAVANISRETDGYFLSLTIQNIFDNKVVFSSSLPCPQCNAYDVVDKLRNITDPDKNKPVAAEQKELVPYKLAGLYIGLQFGKVGTVKGVNDTTGSGYLLGYRINDAWRIELGSASLYKDANADAMAANINPGSTGNFTLNATSLSGQYGLPLGDNTSLLMGLGYFNANYTLNSSGISVRSGKTSGVQLGLKAEYALSQFFSVRAGVDMYNMGGELKGLLTQTGAGLMLAF